MIPSPAVPRRTVLIAGGAATIAGGISLGAGAPARGDTVPPAPDAGLADLVLDHIGRLHPDFDPAVTEYTATAYRSLSELSLRAITTGGATALVAGAAPDPAAHDRVTVTLTTGENVIKIIVDSGSATTAYTVTITKLTTDYRGRELVEGITASSPVGEADGRPLSALFDGDRSTSWHPAGPLVAGDPGDDGVTTLTLDLGTARTVGRISGHALTPAKQWYPDEWKTYVGIDVSADGTTWNQAAGHATLRQDQDILYWELGNYYRARYVRITLRAMDVDLDDDFGLEELEVFALPEGVEAPTRHPAPADGSIEHAFVPTQEHVGRAQELARHHGIVVAMWATSDGFAAGSPDAREYEDLASPTAQFYDPPFRNTDLMAYSPEATWSIAKAPAGGNGIEDAGDPYEYLPEALLPYASRYIDAQYGDEGGYSTSEVDAFATWFSFSRETYPQAITHANQYDGSTWNALENMRHFVRTARPDLLSFDRYYWQGGGAFGAGGPDAWNATQTLLSTGISKTQRQAALEGLTGDGSEPILYGQYLDAFDHNGSQSQKAIVTSLSLASGMKWLSLFRLEINRFDGNSFFDVDGAPLRSFWEMADILARVRTMSPFLTALHHEWLAVQPGLHLDEGLEVAGTAPNGYRMAAVADSSAQLLEHGIAGLSATNVGTQNDGLPGDVAIGLFEPLPGLPAADLEDTFGTATPHAFMLVNGLISNAELPSTKKLVRHDDGQYWQTAQEIRVSLVPPAGAELRRVDPTSGTTSMVRLDRVASDGGHEVSFSTRLGGGQFELYYWTTPGIRLEVDADPLEIVLGDEGTVVMTLTNASPERTRRLTISPVAPEGWSLAETATTDLGALDPGASISYRMTVRNEGALGDAAIDLGLMVHRVRAHGTVHVRGVVDGEVITPEVVAADSEETTGEDAAAARAVDGDPATFWHTQWSGGSPGYPHWVVLDLGRSAEIGTLRYLPRQDAAVGVVKDFEVYVSEDPESFPESPAVSGTVTSSTLEKVIGVLATGRYLKFQGLEAWDGKPFMVAAELDVQLR